MENDFYTIINYLEHYCNTNNLSHRFVGSVSYGGLLKKDTTWNINIQKRIIRLNNYALLTLKRDDKTIRDIDMIVLSPDRKKVHVLKQYINELKSHMHLPYFPLISIEAANYPSFGKRNILFQFVTGLEVTRNSTIQLTFDNIKQPIPWKSLEPWKVVLSPSISYTTRNPIADYYAYLFRSPAGIKPKDISKVHLLQKLANEMVNKGTFAKLNYTGDQYYANWELFIRNLQSSKEFSIGLKKFILKHYWHTIGTDVAHGKGIWGFVINFSNQFTGIKQ